MTEFVAAVGALACFVGLVGGGPIWIVAGVTGLIWAYAKAMQPAGGRDVRAVTAVQKDAEESTKDLPGIATRCATAATANRDVKEVSDTTQLVEKVWTRGDRVIQPTYGL